ncbi:ABC transporter substrate-binding protein [Acaryochloris sp. CCMEE 5410]|uniref:ABC transporter substrate-binding protein n=1 Tax=Acaryochloris sp. CCMEE 5410 TaxID=310037 RepID=UPI0002483849|nr:iron-siderophore ABC transporter substrate-binding protein [Acaryochloris sp. CCMEE 5410]KAI9135050.1 iron-siderophore ABC transporter substrate-binding protein [Acaryochloris sp. CCMEE 5410]
MVTVVQALSLGLLVGALTLACGTTGNRPDASTPTSGCERIKHDGGETEICRQPQTIVAIGPNVLELLLALDIQPVGYADYYALPFTDFDQPQSQIPYLGERLTGQVTKVGTWNSPSLEAILKLKPDLIVGSTLANQGQYSLLSQAAPTLLFSYGAKKGWQTQLRLLAKVLNRSEKAEQVIATHNQLVAEARKKLQPTVQKYPQVLLLASEQLEQGLAVENSGSRCGGLLENLGFKLLAPKNIGTEGPGRNNISLELLPKLKSDWILFLAWNTDFSDAGPDLEKQQISAVRQQWQENEIAQSLPASKSNQVYFHSAYVCRALPGPIGTELLLEQFQADLLPSVSDPTP